MNLKYYNRYSQFTLNGVQKTVPFVTLPSKGSDLVFFYKKNRTKISGFNLKITSKTFCNSNQKIIFVR